MNSNLPTPNNLQIVDYFYRYVFPAATPTETYNLCNKVTRDYVGRTVYIIFESN